MPDGRMEAGLGCLQGPAELLPEYANGMGHGTWDYVIVRLSPIRTTVYPAR